LVKKARLTLVEVVLVTGSLVGVSFAAAAAATAELGSESGELVHS
jgi:hypothetical protein